MTDVSDYKAIKAADTIARRLGFIITTCNGHFVLETKAKGLPATMNGPNEEMFSCATMAEMRSYLTGWNHFLGSMNDIEFDEAEYKKRAKDIEVMDRLKRK